MRSFGLLILAVLVTTSGLSAQRTGLTGAQQLARVYDAIFDARFDQLESLLDETCEAPTTRGASRSGVAPDEVCQLLAAVSLWWQIQLDPDDRSLDGTFATKIDAAIVAAEAWTSREPERAEAWFYLGGAYGARAQWRVLRGERLAAARDGKRIKEALERALVLDPNLHDAYFGIGLYHYYADVAPAAARILRWLLLLPGGDRVEGLQEMIRARNRGQLLRSEADYQLHLVYLWYEKQPERALELLRTLSARHPRNPHFYQLIAEVEDVYLHDLTASLRSWQALLERAEGQRVAKPAVAETAARLGIALQLDRLFETDAAVPHLRAVIAAKPSAPFGALSRAHLQLGQALDRMGSRDDAVASYRAALSALPAGAGDPAKIAARARAGIRVTPDPAGASAYRLSLEGWRALERGALAEASRALEQSLALRPADPVTRYRQARLQLAQNNDDAALTILESLIASSDATPPVFFALACLDAARVHEERGEHPRAIELYQLARAAFGADQRVKDAAARALARLIRARERRCCGPACASIT